MQFLHSSCQCENGPGRFLTFNEGAGFILATCFFEPLSCTSFVRGHCAPTCRFPAGYNEDKPRDPSAKSAADSRNQAATGVWRKAINGFVGLRFEDFSAFINIAITESIEASFFDSFAPHALLQSPHPDSSPAAWKLPQPDSPA